MVAASRVPASLAPQNCIGCTTFNAPQSIAEDSVQTLPGALVFVDYEEQCAIPGSKRFAARVRMLVRRPVGSVDHRRSAGSRAGLGGNRGESQRHAGQTHA